MSSTISRQKHVDPIDIQKTTTTTTKMETIESSQDDVIHYWVHTNRRYVLYSMICFGYFCNAICLSLVSPSLDDLTGLINITMEQFSYAISIRFIANCIASLAAGFTYQKFNRQLQYTIALVCYGLLTIITPRLNGMNQFSIVNALFGCSSAYIDIATNVWILELFTMGNVNLHMQLVYFVFALGQIIGPLFVSSYLAPAHNETNPIARHDYYQTHSHIELPYTIGGSLFFFGALAMALCWFYKPYVAPDRTIDGKDVQESEQYETNGIDNFNQSTTPPPPPYPGTVQSNSESNFTATNGNSTDLLYTRSDDDRNKKRLPFYYYGLIVVIIQIVNALEVSCEYNFDYYIPTYLSKSSHKLDKDVAAHMAAYVGSAYAVGRFISILMAVKTGVHRIIYASIFLLLITNALFFVCPTSDVNWIRPLVFMFGLGFAALFPALLSFIEQRVNVTNTLNATMLCFSTSLFCINSIIIGSSIETNPQWFLYLNTGYPVLFLLFFVLLHCTDLLKKRLLNKQD